MAAVAESKARAAERLAERTGNIPDEIAALRARERATELQEAEADRIARAEMERSSRE
jgi:hypothetical protein